MLVLLPSGLDSDATIVNTTYWLVMLLRVKEVFGSWLQQVNTSLEEMRGWQSSRLLETDTAAGGHLKVFFSSRLTDVLTQVRDVAALGFKIPGKLTREVKVCYIVIMQACMSFPVSARHCCSWADLFAVYHQVVYRICPALWAQHASTCHVNHCRVLSVPGQAHVCE